MSRFYDLYDFPLFADTDRERIDHFLHRASSRISSYKTGDLVVMQGDPCVSLMLLCAGSLSARMESDDGKELVLETLVAPEVLAPAFLYGSDNHFPVTLWAEEDARIWFLSREDFLIWMGEEEAVLRNFLRQISDRTVFLGRKLNEFALQDLEMRVMNYLREHGEIRNVREVAERMGVARPSLSRALSLLVRDGHIRKEEGVYRIA